MSFLDTLRKNLTPELFAQVTDALGDDFDYDMVPRSRLNKVIAQRNTLKAQVAGVAQPTKGNKDDSNKEEDDSDAPFVDVDSIKQQFQKEANEQIQELKIQYAALEQLRSAEVVDPELVWNSNVFDKSKVTLDESGKLSGLEEQITTLKDSKSYLFKLKEPDVPAGTGKTGGEDDFKGVTSKEEFLKLPIDKQLAFKEKNPETFKTFLN